MSNRGLGSIGIRKIIPGQIDFTKIVSGSAAGPGSFIALSSAGNAVLVNAKNLIDDSLINHDSLTGFVANEHIDHSSVSITAGTGLSGGGTIASTRTLSLNLSDVIANDGANRILTSDGDGTLTAESTITYDGANERLGLGTTSPSVKLDIVGESAGETQIRMAQHNTDSDAPDIRLYKSRGTEASPTAVANDDNLARVNSFAYNGSSYVQAGTFGWNADGTDGDSYFTLSTRVGGTTANRLTVNAAGNIELAGTISSAGSALPVDIGGTGQTSYTNGQLLIGNTTGNTLSKATLTAGTGIDITNGAGSITVGVDVSDFMANGSNNRIVTATGTDGQNAEANLTFDGSTLYINGDAGIGTDDPKTRLHVYEDISFSEENPADLGDWDNYQVVIRGGSATGKTAGILLSTTNDTYGGSAIVHYDAGSFGKGDLAFYTKQSTAAEPPVEVMRLDADGHVTKPAQPAFSVYLSANQTIPSSTTTVVEFDTELFDQNDDFSTANNEHRFVAPVDGKYLFTGTIEFNNIDSSAVDYELVHIRINNQQNIRVIVYDPDALTQTIDVDYGASFAAVVHMDANDQADIIVYSRSDSVILDGGTPDGGCSFHGYLLG